MAKTYKEYAGEDAQFADAVKIVKQIRWPDPDYLMKEMGIGYTRARQLASMVDEYFTERKYFDEDSIIFDIATKQIGDRFYDAKGNSILVSPTAELYGFLQKQVMGVDGEILGCV